MKGLSKTLVTWTRVQRPLHLGGLGVIDMRLVGVTLRVRWLWLLKTDPSHAWSSLSCLTGSLTIALFDALVELRLGNGESFIFWTDAWLHGEPITVLAPDLVQAVSGTARKWWTVAAALLNHAWVQDITRALIVPMIIQYIELRQRLQHI
jgi:hypothetical protein